MHAGAVFFRARPFLHRENGVAARDDGPALGVPLPVCEAPWADVAGGSVCAAPLPRVHSASWLRVNALSVSFLWSSFDGVDVHADLLASGLWQGYINDMGYEPQMMMGKARVVFESAARADDMGAQSPAGD